MQACMAVDNCSVCCSLLDWNHLPWILKRVSALISVLSTCLLV